MISIYWAGLYIEQKGYTIQFRLKHTIYENENEEEEVEIVLLIPANMSAKPIVAFDSFKMYICSAHSQLSEMKCEFHECCTYSTFAS